MSKQFVHVQTMTVRHLISLDCFMFFPSMLPLIKALIQHSTQYEQTIQLANKNSQNKRHNQCFPFRHCLTFEQTHGKRPCSNTHPQRIIYTNHPRSSPNTLPQKTGPNMASKHRFWWFPKTLSDRFPSPFLMVCHFGEQFFGALEPPKKL